MKFLHLLFPMLLIAVRVSAQTDTVATQPAVQLNAVEVYGIPPQKYAAGSKVYEVDAVTLKNYASTDLGELLRQQSFIYIKTYGSGMLSSAAFRGTGASHTAVLWNGFNVNSPTLGQADFSILPLFNIDQLSVQCGSASALYGSGAVGGSIQLGSKPEWQPASVLTLQQQVGSFGSYQSQVAAKYARHHLELRTSFFRNSSENNFSFKNTTRFGSPLERQQHAAVSQYGVAQDVYYRLSTNRYLSLNLWYTDTDRELQPTMSVRESFEKQHDRNFRATAAYHQHNALGYLQVSTAYFNEWMSYSDRVTHSVYPVQRYFLRGQHEVKLGQKVFIKAGAEWNHITAEVEQYGRYRAENRGDVFISSRYEASGRVTLAMNLRKGLATGFRPPLTPSVGADFRLINSKKHQLVLKTLLSEAYRVPTLNERYWTPGGNPGIRPENSISAEAGLDYKLKCGKIEFQADVTHFRMGITDMITWTPRDLPDDGTANKYWSPVNINRAFSRGWEGSAQVSYQPGKAIIRVGMNLSYCRSTSENGISPWKAVLLNNLNSVAPDDRQGKQLVYVPLWNGTVFTRVEYGKWQFNLNTGYTGLRHTTSDNEPLNSLAAFSLTNVSLQKEWMLHKKLVLNAAFRINNLFNTTYQNYENKAMPLRNYSVSLLVKLGS